jgi:hypothetical protein
VGDGEAAPGTRSGQTNFAYVRIKNRGTQAATNVVVKGFHALPGVGLVFPTDWGDGDAVAERPLLRQQQSAPSRWTVQMGCRRRSARMHVLQRVR